MRYFCQSLRARNPECAHPDSPHLETGLLAGPIGAPPLPRRYLAVAPLIAVQCQLEMGAGDNYRGARVAFFFSNPTAANALMPAGLEKKNAHWGERLTAVDNCHWLPFLIGAEHRWPWGGFEVAIPWLSTGFRVALGWLAGRMWRLCPALLHSAFCLLHSSSAALSARSRLKARGSRLKVRRSP